MELRTERRGAKLVTLPSRGPAAAAAPGATPGRVARILPWRADPRAARAARAERLAVGTLFLLAAVMRLWGLFHDLPFSYYGDELHFMKRAMALGTGDLDPHWFHKPAFLMYVLLAVYGVYFLLGLASGRFDSTAAFGAAFLTAPGPFLLLGRLVVFACGVATVVAAQQLARRVFGREAGIATALAAAVLPPMVASSQTIKSDVPAGLLMTVAVLVYVCGFRRWRSAGFRLVAASLLAGVAMGTHYYGVVLVPGFMALEALRSDEPLGVRARRVALVPLLFVVGFFVASPYNFLDPTWGRETFGQVREALGMSPHGAAVTRFDPDSRVEYTPGVHAWGGATVAFARVLASPEAMGVGLTVLALAGIAAALRRSRTRRYGLLVLLPFLAFTAAAVTIVAYHAQPRHLNAIYPLLCTVLWPGAATLARVLRLPGDLRRPAAGLAIGLACLPGFVATASANAELTRLDSRLVAYRWVLANLPPDARVLLDDYGPPLNPNPAAVRRQQAMLPTLPHGPFTANQDGRLKLLAAYPPADGRDIVELGHPWWLPQEKSDAELRRDPHDLDMGNPLVSRQPRTVAEYRADGIRYVVTNSDARERYFGRHPAGNPRFPSFVRFYDELRAREPLATFDPQRFDGKGPVVWVYDLGGAGALAQPLGD